MTFLIKNDGYTFLIRLDLMFFYVIMKGVPIITNFKQRIHQHVIKLMFCENDLKLLKFKGSPV